MYWQYHYITQPVYCFTILALLVLHYLRPCPPLSFLPPHLGFRRLQRERLPCLAQGGPGVRRLDLWPDRGRRLHLLHLAANHRGAQEQRLNIHARLRRQSR